MSSQPERPLRGPRALVLEGEAVEFWLVHGKRDKWVLVAIRAGESRLVEKVASKEFFIQGRPVRPRRFHERHAQCGGGGKRKSCRDNMI